LKFWAMGSEAEALEVLLPQFERRHPGLRVDLQQIPWSVAHEKLLTAYVGGALPDVFQLGNTWIAELAAIGAVDDLAGRFAASGAAVDFFPGILAANQVQGGLYGIPWYVDTRLLFYRADLLEHAGWPGPPHSWSQWAAMMASLSALAPAGRHALALSTTEWQFPVILALQRGAPLLREDGRYGDFQSAAFQAAFGLFLDAFRKAWAPRLGDTQIGNPVIEFARGRFLFFIGGPWMMGELGRRLPTGWQGRWETAPMPSWDGPYPGASLAGGSSLAISTRSEHREAAWALIEFLSKPAQQIAFFRLTGDLPSRRSSWNDPALTHDPHAQPFRAQLEHTLAVPKVPEWERIAAKIGYYAEQAVRGSLGEDEALRRLDRDVDAILEKRRWLLEQRR
ncbi:MAG: extracellular solute-binding protein, partial [Gammaproteobacteria bacterium]|nr:extracellular solute-binding protein [Gammaproteobacteria bacterium]